MTRHRECAAPVAATVLAVVAAVACHLVPGAGPAGAAAAGAWTDTVVVGGTSVGAATVAAPSTFTCGLVQAMSLTFSWSAFSGATGYTLHYGLLGSQTRTTTATTATVTTLVDAGTAWVTADQAVGSTTWSSRPSTTRTYTVAGLSLCA